MRVKYVAFFLLILVSYFYLDLFANALTDDAFITIQYVKTLLHTGTWGFLPGYVTNAVTSPLNIFLLALISLFLGATVNAVIWLSAILLAWTVFMLVQLSMQLFESPVFGVLAAGAFMFNPLVISTLGLESILFASLYISATSLYHREKWQLLAITLGLITITRFDGVLFFLVTLLLVPTFRLRLQFTAIYLLCMLPWYVFSWIYLGSFFPDTLFIKTFQHAWGNWDFFNGVDLYLRVYRLETILSFAFLPLLLLLFYKPVRDLAPIQFLLLTGFAHFAGYSILNVPPYYWYYIPEITAIILIGSFGLGVLFQEASSNAWMKSLVSTLFILQVGGLFYILARGGLPVTEMPIHTNWATHEQYREIGLWLKEQQNGSMILVDGEIGTLGYYCDCHLSSFFSERKWLEQHIQHQTANNGFKSLLYKVNFLFLQEEKYFSPEYILAEIPAGKTGDKAAIKEWETGTKWTSQCLVKLSAYSP